MKIKALVVKQPWADLIAAGFKTIETRTWTIKHRGPVLIVVARSPKAPNSGQAICMVDLYGCRPMTARDEERACLEVYPRANSWLIRNVRDITPFPVAGRLGLFEIQIPPGVYFK